MPKSSRKKIDTDEKNIILELQKNSRKSIDRIAKKQLFSRQKVWRIIKRLEKNKTIWGYSAIVNEGREDHKSYILLIKKTTLSIDKNMIDKIINREVENLASTIRIQDSLYVHGVYDWFVSIVAKDIKDVKKFCDILNKEYPGYIAKLDIIEVLFPIKQHWILNPKIKDLKEFF